jgi:hypothetical protein
VALRHPDLGAHEPGCTALDPRDEQVADPLIAYIDVFCECHRYTEPKVLTNGTDIAWPAGWTKEQAHEWRNKNNLMPPASDTVGIAQSGK